MRLSSHSVFIAAIVAAAPLAGASVVTTIATWNVGTGQPQGNFLYDSNPSFPGGAIELGQRATFRQSATYPTVSGNTYTVYNGYQTAGQYGAPVTATNRNRWNFDYHIYYAGGVQNLNSLTMVITSPSGNTVSAASFDMLTANNDNVTGSTPYPGGDSQNPAFFIQDSQNPVFAPWFNPSFDMSVTGTYTFTLTAVEGSSTFSQTMNINVLPTPGAAAILGLGGLVTTRRRRR
jgi:hypothetical protein